MSLFVGYYSYTNVDKTRQRSCKRSLAFDEVNKLANPLLLCMNVPLLDYLVSNLYSFGDNALRNIQNYHVA